MSLIVTTQSYDARVRLKKDYETRKRGAVVEKQIAREQGDLRENAGFAEAKRDIRLLGNRIHHLGLERLDLEIVNPKEWCNIDMFGEPNACVGAIIEIERGPGVHFNGQPTQKETYIIGGAWDGDLENSKILPYTSPLAKLLIPHDVGYKGVLETSGEIIQLVSSRPPTMEELKAFYPNLELGKKKPKPDIGMDMSM